MSARVTALSFHADYRCQRSGRCCTADWDIPVELPVYRRLEGELRQGSIRLPPAAAGVEPFVLGPDLPPDVAAMINRTDDGHCVFFERQLGGLGPAACAVHRDLGGDALAATCRHFPRLAVADRRGTAIGLSHFCPTAAAALFREDVPVAIVESPPAFPLRDYDGLSSSDDDIPPLLTPRVLMDLDGYDAWERHMVGRCADVRRAPESVVATLVRDARQLARWRPGAQSLVEAVAALPGEYEPDDIVSGLDQSLIRYREVLDVVPDDLKPAPDEVGLEDAYVRFVRPRWCDFRAPLNRYLAAKAFASWTAYQGRGMASLVRGIEAALALVRVEASRRGRNAVRPLDRDMLLEAIRESDFLLNHLAVGEELALVWSSAEATR